jgi:hypothetical protein
MDKHYIDIPPDKPVEFWDHESDTPHSSIPLGRGEDYVMLHNLSDILDWVEHVKLTAEKWLYRKVTVQVTLGVTNYYEYEGVVLELYWEPASGTPHALVTSPDYQLRTWPLEQCTLVTQRPPNEENGL